MAERHLIKIPEMNRLQRFGFVGGVIIAFFGAAALVVIWFGLYNISARKDHFAITTALLALTRDRAVEMASNGVKTPPLDDEGLIRLGAEHYRTGCAPCHGAPGEQNQPIFRRMLPKPPDLTQVATRYDPRELAWVVHNGFKFTGMPAWPSEDRFDETWALAAFLEALNRQGPDLYQALEPLEADDPGATMPPENCVRCHGDRSTPPIADQVPALNGISEPYLRRALVEYRQERRPSGFMIPIAHELSDEDVVALAAAYADLPRVAPVETAPAPEQVLALGRRIAEDGLPEAGVPACASCHEAGNPQFPRLDGQPAAYLRTQLEVWRDGYRDRTAFGRIMGVVAKRLTTEQAKAVSLYLSRQTFEETAEAAR